MSDTPQPGPTWQRVTQVPNPDGQDTRDISYTDRLAVPGGWIYRTYRWHFSQFTESSVFVPAPPSGAAAERAR